MKTYIFIFCLLFVVAVPFLYSQNEDEQNIIINEEVVVSATKNPEDAVEVPGSATVITAEELKRSGAKTIAEAIQETGASSMKDMGKVMKATQARLAGKTADGSRVSQMVKEKLA